MIATVDSATTSVLAMLRTREVLSETPPSVGELLDVAEKLAAAKEERLRSKPDQFNVHAVAGQVVAATRENGSVPSDLEDRVAAVAVSAEQQNRVFGVLDAALQQTARAIESAVRESADELIATQLRPKFDALMTEARTCLQHLDGKDLRADVDEVFRWPRKAQDALRRLSELAEQFGRIRASHFALTTTQSSDGFWARQLRDDVGEIIRPDQSDRLRQLLHHRPDQHIRREAGKILPDDHRYRLEILAALPATEVWCPTVAEMQTAQTALIERLREPARDPAARAKHEAAIAELDRRIESAAWSAHYSHASRRQSPYVSPFDSDSPEDVGAAVLAASALKRSSSR